MGFCVVPPINASYKGIILVDTNCIYTVVDYYSGKASLISIRAQKKSKIVVVTDVVCFKNVNAILVLLTQ